MRAPSSACTPRCALRCAGPTGGRPCPPPGCSTASRCGARKRGAVGYDAGKKVKGKKRFLVVDTLGLILAAFVCSAGAQEPAGARVVLRRVAGGGPTPRFARLTRIWADHGYLNANLLAWARQHLGYTLDIMKRPAGVRGFTPLPRRWVVERTFAWLGRYRRLSKDYEQTPASSEAYLYLAMTALMLRRLTR